MTAAIFAGGMLALINPVPHRVWQSWFPLAKIL